LRIFTIGHSTRTIEEFCELLDTYKITLLVDARRFPHSYRNPQFNKETIQSDLSRFGIRYHWLQKLGGRRDGLGASSKNTCWRNRSFRNYADYMETGEFLEGIQELLQVSASESEAIMCAEATYWKCHRSLIADALKSKGVDVIHILDRKHAIQHEYNHCARIILGNLTYHEQNLERFAKRTAL